MDITTHCARITEPVAYRADNGPMQHIPIGPCLVEILDKPWIDIIWGANGQSSAALPLQAVETAQTHGHLVLLD